MKMITAVISKKDTDNVCSALTEGGFYFTKMLTSGGFLRSGNTTVLIGTEEEKVQQALDIIRTNCSRRVEKLASTTPHSNDAVNSLSEVAVGGATVFVASVEKFEKM